LRLHGSKVLLRQLEPPHLFYIQDPCDVVLSFDLDAAAVRNTALFNLLKATIDGLSSVLFAPANPAKPTDWHREDWLITGLTASMRLGTPPRLQRSERCSPRPTVA
jgi:hypothetical protein